MFLGGLRRGLETWALTGGRGCARDWRATFAGCGITLLSMMAPFVPSSRPGTNRWASGAGPDLCADARYRINVLYLCEHSIAQWGYLLQVVKTTYFPPIPGKNGHSPSTHYVGASGRCCAALRLAKFTENYEVKKNQEIDVEGENNQQRWVGETPHAIWRVCLSWRAGGRSHRNPTEIQKTRNQEVSS